MSNPTTPKPSAAALKIAETLMREYNIGRLRSDPSGEDIFQHEGIENIALIITRAHAEEVKELVALIKELQQLHYDFGEASAEGLDLMHRSDAALSKHAAD